MKILGVLAAAVCAVSSTIAAAEPVKITNIGHGYFSAALYVAKQEKIFEKYGLEPDISYVQGGALALQATLTKQAQWLRTYPAFTVTIEGHADERGTREYNIALGARRAQAVREYLASRGVEPSRMRTISYGKERPVAVCNDASCWTQNRRAVTVLNGGSS